jgi:hypothetical protein
MPHVMKAGPLPIDPLDRADYIAVAQRGMNELRSFLSHVGFSV